MFGDGTKSVIRGNAADIVPVSYTHLDVYKRQPYRKLETDQYHNITRIACLQHVKRKFLEQDKEPDARKIVEMINPVSYTHLIYRQIETKLIGLKYSLTPSAKTLNYVYQWWAIELK